MVIIKINKNKFPYFTLKTGKQVRTEKFGNVAPYTWRVFVGECLSE
jgi:hypothetical protein